MTNHIGFSGMITYLPLWCGHRGGFTFDNYNTSTITMTRLEKKVRYRSELSKQDVSEAKDQGKDIARTSLRILGKDLFIQTDKMK